MFAIPTHPYSCQPFASAQTHPTLYDLDYDLLAPYSYHQRQVALEEQARREAIACRYGQQEYEEQQAALAYRAALLRQLGLEEEERQNVEAQRQARLREQLRQQQEEERVRRKVVERTLISGPTLFDMLFGAPSPHAAPSQPTDDRPTALPAPPGIPVAFHPSSTPTSEPAPAADPPSPLLPIFGSSATGAHENDCHSIASSSDTHSSASSVSTDKSSLSPSKRASALSTLSSLISSLDARRNTPFLAYEDFLVSLLWKVDAVDSHGDKKD
ncbi:hypothetical protein JCM11641_001141 [Rhodosporidiobolus odoratus]